MRILNTWQGNVPIAPDYGIPDFIDLIQTFPESVKDIERSMRQVITKYEPRLTGVRVNFLPSDEGSFRLRFQIQARLKQDEGRKPVFIQTEIDSDGRVEVRV
jgi:type VI secretion system protein